jgi:hypothetical protein
MQEEFGILKIYYLFFARTIKTILNCVLRQINTQFMEKTVVLRYMLGFEISNLL